jgi:hypothetical protein
LVDLFQCLKLIHIFSKGDRCLPVAEIMDTEKACFLAAEIDRNSAHADIEPALMKIVH